MNSEKIMAMEPEKRTTYRNMNRDCRYCLCELENKCPVAHKIQRLPREQKGLGMCRKLK